MINPSLQQVRNLVGRFYYSRWTQFKFLACANTGTIRHWLDNKLLEFFYPDIKYDEAP